MKLDITPGPWWHSNLEVGTVPLMLTKVARVNGRSIEEAMANGRAIAALPDLLRSLIEMTPPMPPADASCHEGITTQGNCKNCIRIAAAHAAIAQATGSKS